MVEILILSFISTVIAVGIWALIDPWFRLVIQVAYGLINIAIRRSLLRLKLSYEIFWIKRSHTYYLNEIHKARAGADEESAGS